MLVQLSFLHFIILLLPPTLSLSISKPECPDRCGSLSIPFPFGIGSDCSLDNSFSINCNTSSNYPPKAYLSIINAEIVEINETYIRVKYPSLATVCYEGGAPSYKHSMSLNLSGTPYRLSESNRIMALGCDDMIMGFNQANGSLVMSSGCSAFCSGRGGVGYCLNNNANALGNGYCDAPISGEDFLGSQLIDTSGKLVRERLYPCSYAVIKEWRGSDETVFSYPLNYLEDSTAWLHDEMPVVRLDWRIVQGENCSQSVVACGDKSVCIDSGVEQNSYIGRGYLCRCVHGYEGNPYLPGGCKPISGFGSIAKTGCEDQCGELLIPFPFGVGENCSLAPSFNIHCNNSTNPPKAYLLHLNAEIIKLSSSQVWVNYPNMGLACHNVSNKTEEHRLILDLSETPYSLSEDNSITAVGCHDILLGISGTGNRSLMGSCATFCQDGQNMGSCQGDGCCRIPIPGGTTYLEANLTDLSEYQPRTNSYCTYAFVENKNFYSSTYSILSSSKEIQLDVNSNKIMGLNWRINGAVNCEEALLNNSFACMDSNSYCLDFDATIRGYTCNCSEGYQGNPYLTSGCQDINECEEYATYPCTSDSFCHNTLGSFLCSCPKGYKGDGRIDGNGCTKSQTHLIILIGLLCSALGFLLLLSVCFWLHKVVQKRKRKKRKENLFKHLLIIQQQQNEDTFSRTKLFPAKELERATDHFNENRILGKGGEGTVYKGMLHDGKIVAVKKLKHVDEGRVEQFINEVVILSQINHRNVIKLLGCCLETEVPLLVYEFLPNGTLYNLIHDSSAEFPISWNIRLKIAADVAAALTYMHSASSMPIYHRDIKTSNFLLDEKYVVKVADFGISKLVALDQTHLTTANVKGTFGYFDPEYFQSRQYTEKSDVFSFGVVLAELLTGRKPIFRDIYEEVETGLATHFLTSMEENSLDTILDPQVSEHNRKEEVIAVARLAQRCLNPVGRKRPTMKEVSTELESLRISHMPEASQEKSEEARSISFARGYSTMFSDIQCAWTTSSISETSATSSDIHPLMIETI